MTAEAGDYRLRTDKGGREEAVYIRMGGAAPDRKSCQAE